MDRQLNGLLKLTARMLSRDNYAGILIELLSRIFTPLIRLQQQQLLQQQQASLKSASIELTTAAMESAAASVAAPSLVPTAVASAATKSRKQRDNHHHKNDNDDDDDVLSFDSPNPHTTNDSLQGLSNQIAAGMWRILTQNVDLLPLLSLEQWECLFKIIAFGSNSGSFAAFKSFEVMAWLLHEPRLFASVPVFCIIAVKPLVYNKQAPIFVSTGAVKLLKYLHSRLEAIIHDSYKPKGSADSNDNDNNNNNNNDNKNNAGNTAGNSNNNGGNEKDLKKNNDLGRRSRGNSEDFDEFTTIDETSFAVWKVIRPLLLSRIRIILNFLLSLLVLDRNVGYQFSMLLQKELLMKEFLFVKHVLLLFVMRLMIVIRMRCLREFSSMSWCIFFPLSFGCWEII